MLCGTKVSLEAALFDSLSISLSGTYESCKVQSSERHGELQRSRETHQTLKRAFMGVE